MAEISSILACADKNDRPMSAMSAPINGRPPNGGTLEGGARIRADKIERNCPQAICRGPLKPTGKFRSASEERKAMKKMRRVLITGLGGPFGLIGGLAAIAVNRALDKRAAPQPVSEEPVREEAEWEREKEAVGRRTP